MSRHPLFPILMLASVVGASTAAASGKAAPMSTPHRVHAGRDTAKAYTEEQATAGQAVFTKVCAECHETKDVTGADFKTKWGGRPVFALFEQIRTTMPDGNPGTLSRDEYLATVTYIMKLNGMPAGTTPLASDSVALSAVNLELAPPAR